jgi:hypothetical protein
MIFILRVTRPPASTRVVPGRQLVHSEQNTQEHFVVSLVVDQCHGLEQASGDQQTA